MSSHHIRSLLLIPLLSLFSQRSAAQAVEDLSGLPSNSASSYLNRSWTGTNGVPWNATSARTDRTLNGKAICFGTSGSGKITSPSYSGGMGSLSFKYSRDFSGTASRTLEIWVNGAPIGLPISVDPTSDIVVQYDQAINIGGNIILEIRSTGAGQVKVDDISWTAFSSQPVISFATPASTLIENAGQFQVDLLISAPAPANSSVTIGTGNGAGVIYGAAGDYTTTPAPAGGSITLNIPAGSVSATFTIQLIDDALGEIQEMVTFTLLGASGGLQTGQPSTFTLTITDNDVSGPPTTLSPGDLVIVGVNANDQACGSGNGDDLVSFFCFKPITNGTTIIFTDNGFQRCNAGMWGNSEGTVRLQRTGGTIPAGQVITVRLVNNFGPGNVIAIAPDNSWTCTTLNGNTAVNLNAGGDQLFIMQGGNWNTGTIGAHNATYSGTILFGFTSNPAFPWTASCSSSPSQRSDLPNGIECFSMAPTLATDLNKYSGPNTEASQRNWIIRLDDPANWNSFANCAAYAAQGYNWSAAPVMPIGNASFEAGRWTGAINTDWFECKNWDDARIPTVLTDVIIDQDAIRNCVVGLAPGNQPGGDGLCASLSLMNSGTSRNITIAPGSSLNVAGPINVERTAGTGDLAITIQANASLSGTDVLLNSIATGSARLIATENTSSIILEGGITIGNGGQLDLGSGGTIAVGGNWSNLGMETQFLETSGKVILNGSSDQSIFTMDQQEIFHDLTIQKTGGDVELSSPVIVNGMLDLSTGLINTSMTELLVLGATASCVNASDQSFANGPVKKLGNSDFEFPVGKGSSFRPCALNTITGDATNAFTAEYHATDPGAFFGNDLLSGIDHISQCEYWYIDHTNGVADAEVQLSWDTPESCGITDLAALRVARWDGNAWADRGNGGTNGDLSSGNIVTVVPQNAFGPFTLASVDGSNPLPITLVSFTAKEEDGAIKLEWQTASEMNNDHFTIERSGNGVDFQDLIVVEGAATSNGLRNYAEWDRSPIDGINYYRLRQTDFDGSFTTSGIVSVRYDAVDLAITVIASPDAITAYHSFGEESRFEVLDMSGRTLLSGRSDQKGTTMITIDASIPNGAYLLRITEGPRSESARFIR